MVRNPYLGYYYSVYNCENVLSIQLCPPLIVAKPCRHNLPRPSSDTINIDKIRSKQKF